MNGDYSCSVGLVGSKGQGLQSSSNNIAGFVLGKGLRVMGNGVSFNSWRMGGVQPILRLVNINIASVRPNRN